MPATVEAPAPRTVEQVNEKLNEHAAKLPSFAPKVEAPPEAPSNSQPPAPSPSPAPAPAAPSSSGISAELIARGADLGLTEADLQELGPVGAKAAIAAVERQLGSILLRDNSPAAPANVPPDAPAAAPVAPAQVAQPPAPPPHAAVAAKFADLPPLEDGEYAPAFKAVYDAVRGMPNVLQEIEQRTRGYAQRGLEQIDNAVRAYIAEQRFDADLQHVLSLHPEYASLVGKGPSYQLRKGTPELDKRARLIRASMNNYGGLPLSGPAALRAALSVMFSEQNKQPPQTPSDKPRDESGRFTTTPKPTAPLGAVPSDAPPPGSMMDREARISQFAARMPKIGK